MTVYLANPLYQTSKFSKRRLAEINMIQEREKINNMVRKEYFKSRLKDNDENTIQ